MANTGRQASVLLLGLAAIFYRHFASFVHASRSSGAFSTNSRRIPLRPLRAGSDELEGVRSEFRELGYALDKDFQDSDGQAPRMYYKEMRGTEVGNAFWRQKTEDKWGEKASGDASKFDKDDLVEALYPGTDEWYSAQVMRYVGSSDWIVLWLDVDEGMAQASVVKTKDMAHIRVGSR